MNLKELVVGKGFSRKTFAAAIYVSTKTLDAYIYGTRRPSPEVAQRIATILGLTREEMWQMFYAKGAG